MKTKWDRRTWKRFWAAYRQGGGWTGSATRQWVSEAAIILMGTYEIPAPAAGALLAGKQTEDSAFAEFAKSGGSTAHVIYCVRGAGTETDADRKMLRQIEAGAHVEQIVAAARS